MRVFKVRWIKLPRRLASNAKPGHTIHTYNRLQGLLLWTWCESLIYVWDFMWIMGHPDHLNSPQYLQCKGFLVNK